MKNVNNPKGFKIIALDSGERDSLQYCYGYFPNCCHKCHNPMTTPCYIGNLGVFYCPSCMKEYVRDAEYINKLIEKANIDTIRETINRALKVSELNSKL